VEGFLKVVLSTIAGLIALLGLFLASRAAGGPLEEVGLIVAGGGLIFIFFLLKRHFDQADRRRRDA